MCVFVLKTMMLAKKATIASRPSGKIEGEPRMATAHLKSDTNKHEHDQVPPMT